MRNYYVLFGREGTGGETEWSEKLDSQKLSSLINTILSGTFTKVKFYMLVSVFRWFVIAIIIDWSLSVVTLLLFCSNFKHVFKCNWRKLHALISHASGRNLGIELSWHDLEKFHSKYQKRITLYVILILLATKLKISLDSVP